MLKVAPVRPQIRINSTITKELMAYVDSVSPGNRSYVVRQALECLRLFGSLEAAQACQRREAAYAAFVAGELTREKLEEALR